MTHLSDAMRTLMLASQTTGFATFKCRACTHGFYPPQSFCPVCLSPEVGPEPDSGEATVLSTTRIHRSLDAALSGNLPLHVACVKTATGQSLFAMADRLLPAGARIRIRLRDGLFHAESTT